MSSEALSAAPVAGYWRKEWKTLALIVGGFLLCLYLPVELLQRSTPVLGVLWEALYLVRWYAQEHVVLCLIPAFFIAGAVAVFVGQGSVIKYLGAQANKALAYGVASVSGTLLAVCSCTVLPLFAGIYGMGAGLGPATAFLYAGPAINVLAIIFTARVLGLELGLARAVGAVVFSIVIGLLMHVIFRREEVERAGTPVAVPVPEAKRSLWQDALFFGVLVGILVFANWGEPAQSSGLWRSIYTARWLITGGLAVALALILIRWLGVRWPAVATVALLAVIAALLTPDHPMVPFAVGVVGLSVILSGGGGAGRDWLDSSWEFAKQILPLLLVGVLVAGAALGRPGHDGLIPAEWISAAVGGNSLSANLFASIAGAFMYFATLTEVPILQGLLGSGMGRGPALSLLLAGPALSLPNMLVIRSVIGTRKTLAYVALVVVMSTVAGLVFGAISG